MSLAGFRARNHPQQTRRWGAGDEVDDRATHPLDFADFNERHGPFTLDVAAAAHNTKCPRYFTRDDDGTAQDWSGERVWCNPPYSDIAPWIRKAWDCWASTLGISMLLPANRTEQQWWQLMVEPYRDRAGSPLTVEFLPGRMRFLKPGQTAVGPNQRPPFGCVLLTWRTDVDATLTYRPDRIPAGGLFAEQTEWAAVDEGRIIPIEGATCPADVMRSTHYHGTHGPVGVARRDPGGEWEQLR